VFVVNVISPETLMNLSSRKRARRRGKRPSGHALRGLVATDGGRDVRAGTPGGDGAEGMRASNVNRNTPLLNSLAALFFFKRKLRRWRQMLPLTSYLVPYEAIFYLLMELTLGTLSCEQTPSASNRSRISQANMVGLSFLYLDIASTTMGVATLGLLPPMTPALKLPVS